MNELGEMLKKIRIERGLDQEKLSKILGVTVQTISRWEQGHRVPQGSNLKQLSNALGVSVGYLMGETEQGGIEQSNVSGRFETVSIPIYEANVSCGPGIDNELSEREVIKHISVDAKAVGVMGPKRPFGIYISGSSMEPKIYEGDRVVVNPNIYPGNSDICLACFLKQGFMNEAVKYYYRMPDGRILLKSSTISGIPDMEFVPQQIDDNELIIVGRVMYIDRGEAV